MPKQQRAHKRKRVHLTEAIVRSTPAPSTGRAIIHAANAPHLLLQVMPTGAKAFYVYRRFRKGDESISRPHRIRLGRWPAMTVEQAKDSAARVNGDIARGNDPTAARREAAKEITLGQLITKFLEHARKHHRRDRTVTEYERIRDRYLQPWLNRRITAIDEAAVRSKHATIGEENGRYAANRLLALLSAAYNFAASRGRSFKRNGLGIRGLDNPANEVERFAEEPRTRLLQTDEVRRLFASLASEPNQVVADFVRLTLFTAQRRSTVCSMRWEHVDLDAGIWHIPALSMKSGKAHALPLDKEAISVLKRRAREASDSPFVFPGTGARGYYAEPKKAWAKLLARAGIENARIHDLRRTMGSAMLNAGEDIKTVSKALGHASVVTTERAYAFLQTKPVRDALNSGSRALLTAAKPRRKAASARR